MPSRDARLTSPGRPRRGVALRVGTSGWAYEDWEGTAYPPGLPEADRLAWYAGFFPTVEVNSTFYRDPSAATVKGWVRKTAGLARFELTLKAPQRLTQDALASAPPDGAARIAHQWAGTVAAPLRDAGRLGAVLLQLAPAVRYEDATLARLSAVLDALDGHEVAVEFRHASWLAAGGGLRADALALLDAHGAALVTVDGPPFPALTQGAAPHAYARFHGRNEDAWFRGLPAGDARLNRYDYKYAEEELQPWARRLAALAARKRVVRAYFNNHPGGGAFHNGLAFARLVQQAGGSVEGPSSKQSRLP